MQGPGPNKQIYKVSKVPKRPRRQGDSLKGEAQLLLPLDRSRAHMKWTSPKKNVKSEVPNFIHCNGMRHRLRENGENSQKGMIGSDHALGLVEKPSWSSSSFTCESSGIQGSTPLDGQRRFLERLHNYSGHL